MRILARRKALEIYQASLLIHLGNSADPNLSSETIPRLPTKLGNQISAYVPGLFAKISQSNSHDANPVGTKRRISSALNEMFTWQVYKTNVQIC